MIEVDLLTTDVDLDDARSIKGLADQADGFRLRVLSDVGAEIPIISLDAAGIQHIYEKAHRWDALKASAVTAIGTNAPMTLAYVTGAASTAAATALGALQAGVKPDGMLSAAGSAAATTVRTGATAVGAVASLEGALSIFGGFLQWRLLEGNAAKLEMLTLRLRNTPGLTVDQRVALEQAIVLVRLGVYDNRAGMVGAGAEVTGLALKAMSKAAPNAFTGSASTIGAGTSLALAAFAGSAGAFLNSAACFTKAAGKWASRQSSLGNGYVLAGTLYFTAGAALSAAGAEILYALAIRRVVLEYALKGAAGLTGTAAEIAAQRAAAKFGAVIVLRGLSFVGWGLVFTIAGVVVEGIIAYNDRTPIEAWVENCYFGNEPKWRAKYDTPQLAEAESMAFETAMRKASADAVVSDNFEVQQRREEVAAAPAP